MVVPIPHNEGGLMRPWPDYIRPLLLRMPMLSCLLCDPAVVRHKPEQVPCLRVSDPISRASRRQSHRVLRQRLCAEELRTQTAEVNNALSVVSVNS